MIERSPNSKIMYEWQNKIEKTVALLNFFIDRGYGIYTYEPPTKNGNC